MATEPKRYHLLTGQFFVRFEERAQKVQPQPDADTVRFVPDNPYPLFNSSIIRRYGSVGPDLDNFGINVRFEGVDSLETHFSKQGGPVSHQNLALAEAARDFMLRALGFTNIVFDDHVEYTIKSVANNPIRGYVIANGIEQNGRLLGLVYPGDPVGIPEYDQWKQASQDISGPASRPRLPPALPVFVGTKLLEQSVNWKLIDAGLAYAELYTSMPLDLARHMARRVRELRNAPIKKGIWSKETLTVGKGFIWNKRIESLSDSVMFPKLFRRLAEYAHSLESTATKKQRFINWLRDERFARDRDDRLLLPPRPEITDPPNCEFGNLHDLIKVHGQDTADRLEISLNYNPEDIIVLPDNV